MTQWKYKILFTASINNQILKVVIFWENVFDMLGRQCGRHHGRGLFPRLGGGDVSLTILK
jgi:hypothetical protein